MALRATPPYLRHSPPSPHGPSPHGPRRCGPSGQLPSALRPQLPVRSLRRHRLSLPSRSVVRLRPLAVSITSYAAARRARSPSRVRSPPRPAPPNSRRRRLLVRVPRLVARVRPQVGRHPRPLAPAPLASAAPCSGRRASPSRHRLAVRRARRAVGRSRHLPAWAAEVLHPSPAVLVAVVRAPEGSPGVLVAVVRAPEVLVAVPAVLLVAAAVVDSALGLVALLVVVLDSVAVLVAAPARRSARAAARQDVAVHPSVGRAGVVATSKSSSRSRSRPTRRRMLRFPTTRSSSSAARRPRTWARS